MVAVGVFLPGIWTSHTIVGATSTRFQWITTINNTFASNWKMSQTIVFFFDACIWHRRNSVVVTEKKKKNLAQNDKEQIVFWYDLNIMISPVETKPFVSFSLIFFFMLFSICGLLCRMSVNDVRECNIKTFIRTLSRHWNNPIRHSTTKFRSA